MCFAKRLTAVFVALVLAFPMCLCAVASTATVTVSGTYTVDTNVSYSKLSVASGQVSNTVTGYSVAFSPDDGYMPMVFNANAGGVADLKSQYSTATGSKYGYDVVGVINGSFFTTDTGDLVGLNISNGKIVCATAGYVDEVVAFGSDGSMDIVTSNLGYKLYINGNLAEGALRAINKKRQYDTTSPDKIFYYDTSAGTSAGTTVSSYEVICQKQNNGELSVGSTLFAKVVEVKANTYGTSFESDSSVFSDKFVLSVKTDSAYASYLKDLKSGDDIAISVSENNTGAKAVMEKANSAITNVGWLVKDGVDRTRIDETIGTHSVTYEACWSAFGQKADGSYVFFVSGAKFLTYGGVTLRDVADYMMSQGCVNVIRMDGGGSSAMYLKKTSSGSAGYTLSGARSVADSIMIVKKSSVVDSTLVETLKSAITDAKALVAEYPDAEYSALIAQAEQLASSDTPVSGDVRAMISKLSGKDRLAGAIELVSDVNYYDYGEETLVSLRENYEKAKGLLFASDAEASEVQKTASLLISGYNDPLATVISTGCSYTATEPTRTDSFVDDGVRLTDGAKCKSSASAAVYSGWGGASLDPAITVDLGSVAESDVYTVYVASMSSWGIPCPNSLKIEASQNGSEFITVGSSDVVVNRQSDGASGTSRTNYYSFTVRSDTIISARYIRFTVDGNNHTWIDEVEVARSNSSAGTATENPIFINGINEILTEGDCHIFTSGFGTVTSATANHINTVALVLKYSGEGDKYTVSAVETYSDSAPDITLASDELLLACHSDSTIPSSVENASLVSALAVGDAVNVFGITPDSTALPLAPCAAKIVSDDNTGDNEGGDTDEPTEPEYILGDVNGDDTVDSADCLLVKRAVLNNYLLSPEEKQRADANTDTKITLLDYLLIKRITIGTFVI